MCGKVLKGVFNLCNDCIPEVARGLAFEKMVKAHYSIKPMKKMKADEI